MKVVWMIIPLILFGIGIEQSFASVDSVSLIAFFPPPLKQISNGIEPTKVTCTEGLEIIIKLSNGLPVCVQPSSVEKLIQRGWAVHVLPDSNSYDSTNSQFTKLGEYSVLAETVSYEEFSGFLAKPKTVGEFPGVVIIHEWWGLNDNIKDTAEKIASHGYVVLAIDLFDGQVAIESQDATKMVSEFQQDVGIDNMNSTVTYLQNNHSVEKIGSIGWCFGGGQSLNLALNNENMDASVIYYGRLVTDTNELSKIDWPVLGIFAELDKGIPTSQVKEFESALNQLGIDNEIVIYPGVDHAFANPTGERYAPEETDDAWQKTMKFLKDNLN